MLFCIVVKFLVLLLVLFFSPSLFCCFCWWNCCYLSKPASKQPTNNPLNHPFIHVGRLVVSIAHEHQTTTTTTIVITVVVVVFMPVICTTTPYTPLWMWETDVGVPAQLQHRGKANDSEWLKTPQTYFFYIFEKNNHFYSNCHSWKILSVVTTNASPTQTPGFMF